MTNNKRALRRKRITLQLRGTAFFGLFCLCLIANTATAVKLGRRPPPPPESESLEDIYEDVMATKTPHYEHMTIAGRILPLLNRFLINKDKASAILRALSNAISLPEFSLVAFLGWGMMPLLDSLASLFKLVPAPKENEDATEDDEGDAEGNGKSLQKRFAYQAAKHVSDAAKIGTLVYAADCLAVILNTIGFRYQQQYGFSKQAAHVSFTVWIATRLSSFKKHILEKMFRKSIGGQVRVWDGILNVLLWTVSLGHIMDMFDIDFGVALTSLLSIGGIGTLVFSLASKDMAMEAVSGLIVSASDRFLPGDTIRLGDGTSGVIVSMGLLSMDLRGPDEIVTRLPNSHIANQRTRNLSRAPAMSQVIQTLRFSYSDIHRMQEILEAIKTEIQESCPKLIDDGSRPFRVVWSNFSDDHLEVTVIAHFRIRPECDAYWANRQDVLLAVSRAVKKIGVEFTLPSRICKNQ